MINWLQTHKKPETLPLNHFYVIFIGLAKQYIIN